MAKRIFLIDGHSLLHRAFYALPQLSTSQGEPTGAVYGFTNMLLRLMDEYKPQGVFVAFDVAAPTFRHEQYKDYKATRKKMPDELRPQVGILKEVLAALGIPRIELAGFEADDCIGSAARLGSELGFEVLIVTGDRDALQLIDDNIKVLLTRRGVSETELVDRAALQEKYQLTPSQIVDLKGLMGDSSDNIPGVPGVGEKTALKLLAQYGSIDELYRNIGEIKGKLQERLQENEEQARLSRQLATIDRRVPLTIDLNQQPTPDHAAIVKLFNRLEFGTLLERLAQDQAFWPVVASKPDADAQITVRQADDKNEEAFFTFLKKQDKIALDFCEDQAGLMIAGSEQIWFVPQDWQTGWDGLTENLSRVGLLICYDGKQLYKAFPNCGELPLFDLSLAAYVLDPGASLNFEAVQARYGPSSASSLRVAAMLELADRLADEIEKKELAKLYYQVELPVCFVLANMERQGILVDPNNLDELSHSMEETLQRLTEQIYDIAGAEFNINSPKQLGSILFDKLGLPVIKRTKTGPSTSAEVLEQLSDHPIVEKILEYRQISKLKSTYADALAGLINPQTRRIHTTFHQKVTATGRLSSANPNLQNIPVRTAEGKKIRRAFIAAPGWQLLTADYSQIELRVLAHISQDEKLIEAFNKGEDIHTRTASEVFGIPLEEVTSQQRSAAKAINFGIVYGISSFGLAKGTNLSRQKAQEYIDNYFHRYPGVKKYMDEIVAEATAQGYVTTLLKRRRYLPDINSRNFAKRSFAQRTAMNTPIQGSAADIIKLAMVKVNRALKAENLRARLLLQVHDELVLEVPEDEIVRAAALVKEQMESAYPLDVSLDVDLGVGENWRDVRPYTTAKR